MNAQMLVLALVAVAASCVQAGLVPTNPNKASEQFPVVVPPAGYADYVQPPAPMAPRAHENYYEDVNLAPERHQQQQQQQQQEQPINGQRAGQAHRFGKSLRDLGKIGAQTTRQAYQEAKPTLNEIRNDFNQFGQRVINDPRVQKVTTSLGSHFTNAKIRAQPMLQRGKSHLDRARAHLHRHPQGPVEPGSVYPVPPANAPSQ